MLNYGSGEEDLATPSGDMFGVWHETIASFPAGAARAPNAPLKRRREAESDRRGRRKRMLKLGHDGGRDETMSRRAER